jgi:Bacterial PH domain
MAEVNETFHSAPMGRKLIWGLGGVVTVIIVSVMITGGRAIQKLPPHSPVATKMLSTVAPLLGAAVTFGLFLRERAKVSQFRVEKDELVLGKKRFPLQGLVSVERDPEVLKGALKLWGNGGLGSIRGHFTSKRLGKFETFLTGTENAVVLRWPDKVLAVSPADPEFFILSVQKAASLR